MQSSLSKSGAKIVSTFSHRPSSCRSSQTCLSRSFISGKDTETSESQSFNPLSGPLQVLMVCPLAGFSGSRRLISGQSPGTVFSLAWVSGYVALSPRPRSGVEMFKKMWAFEVLLLIQPSSPPLALLAGYQPNQSLNTYICHHNPTPIKLE
jgi:hypothetical protein